MKHEERNWMIQFMVESDIIDSIDGMILKELHRDARQSVTDIATKAGVSRPTVYERMERMMEKGYIRKFTIDLNYDRCGLPVKAYILVGYDTSKEKEGYSQKTVAKQLSLLPFVRKVNIITGSHDFLLEISIDHMNSLADVIIERIRSITGVGNTVTMVSFMEYVNGKNRTKIPERLVSQDFEG